MRIGEGCDGADIDRVIGNSEDFYWPCVVGEVFDPSIVDCVAGCINFIVVLKSRLYSFGKLHFASQLAPLLVILFESAISIAVTQIDSFKGVPVRPAENRAADIPNIGTACINIHVQKFSF